MLANNKLYLCTDDSVTYDTNYRYKIDIPLYEIKKRKGALYSYFINSDKIASYLNIDHVTLIKSIGSELSCQSNVDNDTCSGYFRGTYESSQLNGILCNFIKNYLICQSCDKPEIKLYLKNNKIRQKCKACGEKHYVKSEIEFSDSYGIVKKHLNRLH